MWGIDLGLTGAQLALVLLGALIAGFTTGVAGFGTALVASGLWFHALPAASVPPLVTLTGATAQVIGLITVRKAFDMKRSASIVGGGLVGLPVGVALLTMAEPDTLRLVIAIFLIAYASLQFAELAPRTIGDAGGRAADAVVGVFGGLLGGFAGLSGPIPLIWLQMRGLPPDAQRATYQPFNLIVLTLAAVGMGIAGHITREVLIVACVCLPVTLGGAWLGAHTYGRLSPDTFRRMVLGLLLISGGILLFQAWAR